MCVRECVEVMMMERKMQNEPGHVQDISIPRLEPSNLNFFFLPQRKNAIFICEVCLSLCLFFPSLSCSFFVLVRSGVCDLTEQRCGEFNSGKARQ